MKSEGLVPMKITCQIHQTQTSTLYFCFIGAHIGVSFFISLLVLLVPCPFMFLSQDFRVLLGGDEHFASTAVFCVVLEIHVPMGC